MVGGFWLMHLVLRVVLGLLCVPGTELNPGVDAAPFTSVGMSR